MKINFYPDSVNDILKKASNEYQEIWNIEGEKIKNALESVTSLVFKETEINALVFEGISSSNPLQLRASYPADTKKGTLVHELGHRLLFSYKIRGKDTLENHKFLNLVLYDTWVVLYGIDFANGQVEVEKKRTPVYAEAWEWALKFDASQRQVEFNTLKSGDR